ncbi:MAG TPA: sigma-70 family RNA polymerase sigma factor [Kofleriaceae bacterium]|nr:sigma-70 family RNA polymerase sigma factor [Kofleriaceae bacterium]
MSHGGGGDDAAATFEPHRAYLVKLAYRMLGSIAEAEDAVQDAFLRWSGAPRDEVAEPRAYLTRTVTRLCVDRLKSARARREQYVGTWLPEPVIEDAEGGPAAALAHELSVALLVTLERLSPLERAAFLLHDVFELPFDEVARTLERSEAAVRQLAARAREHVREDRPRYRASDEEAARLADAFQAAMTGGDLAAISRLLAEDAVFYSDGGGKRAAALNPILGRARILRFLTGITAKRGGPPAPSEVRRAWINGMPGFIVQSKDGVETLAIEVADGAIAALYAVRNPDKLRHLA